MNTRLLEKVTLMLFQLLSSVPGSITHDSMSSLAFPEWMNALSEDSKAMIRDLVK